MNPIKTVARNVTPPVIWHALRCAGQTLNLPSPSPALQLFDGDGALFARHVRDARVYVECGVGVSTVWMHENTSASIHSGDTSQEWINRTAASLADTRRHRFLHVDIGALEDWGRLRTFALRHAFRRYVDGFWNEGISPDLVLIDGRFRISCLIEYLLASAPGTVIVFDDYSGRYRYHVVEEVLEPAERSGMQATFVNDGSFDRDAASRIREAFINVYE